MRISSRRARKKVSVGGGKMTEKMRERETVLNEIEFEFWKFSVDPDYYVQMALDGPDCFECLQEDPLNPPTQD